MKKILKIVITGFLILGLAAPMSFAQEFSTELALFEEIPLVITPGKKLQPITEAPASVYVITQEDIKQSGSIHLWDVLREVPGMDVVTSTIGQGEVSMRGFADLASDKTLLLIDGRSMYIPLQGVLFWELVPVQLEEIERIEVVKGPVASLYGANANLGLINIITKNPEQIDGGTLSVTSGSRDAGRYSFLYGDRQGDVSYKVSGGWKNANSFSDRARDSLDGYQANALLEYQIDEQSRASVSAGMAFADYYYFFSQTLLSEDAFFGPMSHSMSYLKTDYQQGNFEARVYWNFWDADWKTPKFSADLQTHTIDAELRYAFDLGEKHSFILGGGGRLDYAKSNILEDIRQDQAIGNIFFQDEYKINEQFALSGSGRVDHYPTTGFNPSGRLALLFYPNKLDVYRISGGYSFRNPTLTELFVSLPISIDKAGGFSANFFGNEEVDPETYLTYEASYQGRRLDGRLRPFVDLYYTEIQDFIETVPTGGGVIGLDERFDNAGAAYSSGGEIGTQYDMYDWLTLIGSYAFNHVKYDNNVEEKYFNPKHKANAGFKLRLWDDKITAKFLAHYVSGTETSVGDDGKIPAYVMANLWVGYRVRDNLEASIAGYNILHDQHQEITGSDEIGTRILGKLEWKF